MTTEEIVAKLNALEGMRDPESDHLAADELLLAAVPDEVRYAYNRLVVRARWWGAA